ncbi:MAG: amino acid adenylation domain-containing protein [Planctomycetia bacterium]|nr:amino acid adenylation domain-containing protein [Planctomycetia bacterium]
MRNCIARPTSSPGAVYVPLDPKYPSQRLKSILADAAPKSVVYDRPLPADIAATAQSTLSIADFQAFEKADSIATKNAFQDAPHALTDRAVVLYTSGSTGTPKGVVLTHRNLANHNAYVIRMLGLQVGDRRTALASINFDASLEEHFCTLNAGATLVLPGQNTLDSMDGFLKFIAVERLSGFFVTTSLWRELTNYLYETRRELPPTLRALMVGGEQASLAVYRRFLQVGGRKIRWINVYGPTETAIYSSTYEHDPVRDADAGDAPPIGRPIDNTLLYLLDEAGRLVAPGKEGELYIGGLGVSEGYLGREDLTRQKFVENPSPEIPPGRYYRTGDLVRFRADGQLEYVCRLDNQVKLRGFRIEPGEIEATLLQHPTVRDAVVVVVTSPSATRYLAAYVVLQPGASWSAEALRLFAQDRLPEYMVPQTFLQLESLPQSANGKIDRRALPEPFYFEPKDDAEDPQGAIETTELERQILEVWRETFQLDEIGLHDDFFALGGDSLKAMSLTARLEATVGRKVTPTMLFECRTVEHLAAALEYSVDEVYDAPVLLREGELGRPLFFLHSLAGDVWIYRETIAALRSTQAVYGIQLPRLNDESPDAHVAEVAACARDYIEMLRGIQPQGPYRLAGYSSGAWMAYEIARQLEALGEEVEFLGLLDAGVPLALERTLTASRFHRLRALSRNLPLYLGELAGMPATERRRALARCRQAVAKTARRLLGRADRAPADGDAAQCTADGEFMSHFAEDISFFSPVRLRMIKEHFHAIERYIAGPLQGGAHLFRAARQPLSAVQTPLLGWEHLIRGPIRVRNITGTHATLMYGAHALGLAAAIDDELERLPKIEAPRPKLYEPVAV